jgi:hypothetical protein
MAASLMPDNCPSAQVEEQLEACEKHLFLSLKQPLQVWSFKSFSVPEYPVIDSKRDSRESHTLFFKSTAII